MFKDLFDELAGKPFYIVSLSVLGYFVFMNLNGLFFKIKDPFIAIFTQFIWFPLLIIPIVLLIPAIIYCIIDKFRLDSYSFWSLVIILFSNLYIFLLFKFPILRDILVF